MFEMSIALKLYICHTVPECFTNTTDMQELYLKYDFFPRKININEPVCIKIFKQVKK